jgi:hypothetical protein
LSTETDRLQIHKIPPHIVLCRPTAFWVEYRAEESRVPLKGPPHIVLCRTSAFAAEHLFPRPLSHVRTDEP